MYVSGASSRLVDGCYEQVGMLYLRSEIGGPPTCFSKCVCDRNGVGWSGDYFNHYFFF